MININLAIFVFILEISIFGYMGFISLVRFQKYQYQADILVAFASLIGILNGILRYYITFLDNIEKIIIIYRSLNFFLMIQIFFMYSAFTIYYENKISVSVVTFGFVTGILTGAFLYDPEFKVIFDTPTQSYNGVYGKTLLLFIAPLVIFAFIRIVQPLLRKSKVVDNAEDRRRLLIMSTGILIIIFWGIGAGFTSVSWFRMIRPILFAVGWIIWFLAGRSNPFFLSISNAIPKALYVSNDSGHLYYNHNFDKEESYVAELVTPLVSAINSIATDVFQSKNGIEQFRMGDSIVITVKENDYYFHLIATDVDQTLVGMLRFFANSSLKSLEESQSYENIDLDTLVENTFSRLLVISKEISIIPKID